MPPYFSREQIEEMVGVFNTIENRSDELIEAFLLLECHTETGKEYAQHGVARRLMTLRHCIKKVYELLPPERSEIPDRDEAKDATIFIQAFVFHVYGTLDNLAFIWVHERGLKGRNGRPLPNGRIGLSIDKREVRDSLPSYIHEMLDNSADWFSYLEAFRHSLGHRISLYIPPFVVAPDNLNEYQSLDESIGKALAARDFELHEDLSKQRNQKRFFRPFMVHSVTDDFKPVVFHAQLLADFATIEELCRAFLKALEE